MLHGVEWFPEAADFKGLVKSHVVCHAGMHSGWVGRDEAGGVGMRHGVVVAGGGGWGAQSETGS